MFDVLSVRQDDADQLRNGFENVNSYAPVLISCFQNPIIAADEVAVWHDVFGWAIS